MTSWYQMATVARKATYDFLLSLETYHETDQGVRIFCSHLCGEEDIMWKYLYLAKLCINEKFKRDKLDIEQYREYLEVMYPNRTVFFIQI